MNDIGLLLIIFGIVFISFIGMLVMVCMKIAQNADDKILAQNTDT